MSTLRPLRTTFLPFSRPTIEDKEIEEVCDSLRSGWITSGPKVVKFEKLFSEWSGGQEAVAVNSATAGLHIATATLDLQAGEEVITTPITWPSTVNNIVICGGVPVFADVQKDTLQINPSEVEKKISKRTKAIIPVHFAGAPCDLDPLRELCDQYGLTMIEDAAHALGTKYKDELIGSCSEVAVFSFHPIKNITTGEGGMVLCKDRDRAARMRKLRFHGISRDAWKRYSKGGVAGYEVEEPGFKYNMLDIQAAIGIHQFERLQDFNARRKQLSDNYKLMLRDVPEIIPLGCPKYPHQHAWHLFVVRLDIDALTIDRDHFLMKLQEENIGAGLHFPAVHLQKFYRERYGYKLGDFPEAEWNSERIFSLPLYPLLTQRDQEDVVGALCRLIKRFKR